MTEIRPQARIPHVGDVYVFNGLPGGEEEFQDGRSVHIHSISVGGNVIFKIGFLGTPDRRVHSTPLPNALALIQHSVWTLSQDQ